MKKIFLLLFAAMLTFSGCDIHTTKIINGPEMYTDYITARGDSNGSINKNWKTSGNPGNQGCYVYQEFAFNEITRNVIKNGAVMVYLVDADGRDNALPYIHSFDDRPDIVTENIRCEVEKGLLTIIVTWNNFETYTITEDLKFKVCILNPEE